MHESLLPHIAGIIVIGVAAQWLAWRLGFPSILLLLLAGITAGPITGWLDPDVVFGALLPPVVSLSVAIILYEGGLTLRISEMRELGSVLRRLVSIGALVSWVVSAAAAYFILGLSVALSLLLGAILVVTGPTVIAPLLRHIRPTGAVGPLLKWESIPHGCARKEAVGGCGRRRNTAPSWSRNGIPHLPHFARYLQT